MSSQVISYRLSTDEVLALRQKALPGESDNQTAQRLMREALGVYTVSTGASTGSLDDRIESIVEDKLSSFTVNVNDLLSRLQERLQLVESRLEEMSVPAGLEAIQQAVDENYETTALPVDFVDKAVDDSREVIEPRVDAVDKFVDRLSDRSLSQAELAKRLKVHPATLSKNRSKANFAKWSRDKDPEQLAWEYVPASEQYTSLSTLQLCQ